MEQELKHKITREYIELSKLHPNTGQLDGLPKNPRYIDHPSFKKLIQSIKDDPEMLEILKQLLGGDVPTTVIDCPKPAKNPDHPTMKPVPLIGKLISNSSRMGELVLDIFGGSGTTLIACEQLNRSCRMVEFEPVYVDVIIKRWEELSGEKARLIRNIHDGKEGEDAKG